VEEAASRGLLNLPSTVDALPCYTAEKNIRLFETHRVLSETELRSRRDIGLDSYAKMINIEAETMLMMARRQILPAVLKYAGALASSVNAVRAAGLPFTCGSAQLSSVNAVHTAELPLACGNAQVSSVKAVHTAELPLACGNVLVSSLCAGIDALNDCIGLLSDALTARPAAESPEEAARYMHDKVMPAMAALRAAADRLETVTDREVWPFPTYDELLFSIQ
jgi:glutamine synthetase